MAYTSWSVVFEEQPSVAKWNILGANDASFNDGTGIGDGAILSKHLALTTGAGTLAGGSFTTGATSMGTISVASQPVASKIIVLCKFRLYFTSTAAPTWTATITLRDGSTSGTVLDTVTELKLTESGRSQRNHASMMIQQSVAASTAKTYYLTGVSDSGNGATLDEITYIYFVVSQ